MNIDRDTRQPIPEHEATEALLVEKLNAFAKALSGGRWRTPVAHEVSISRAFTERLDYVGDIQALEVTTNATDDEDLDTWDDEAEEVESVFTTVTTSFNASKYEVDGEDGKAVYLARFTVKSTVAQQIRKEDMPNYILDEIFEDSKEEHHPAHELFELAGIDELVEKGNGYDPDDEDSDDLDQLQICRVQELEYVVDYLGNITECTFSYCYTFDDEIVHSTDYPDFRFTQSTRPVEYKAEGLSDRQPIYNPTLTVDTLEKHLQTIKERIDGFFEEEMLRQYEASVAMSNGEHAKRIIGMISLLSTGIRIRK